MVMGTEWNHRRTAVVMPKNRAEISTLFCHSMGAPLAHSHAVAKALSPHQKL